MSIEIDTTYVLANMFFGKIVYYENNLLSQLVMSLLSFCLIYSKCYELNQKNGCYGLNR